MAIFEPTAVPEAARPLATGDFFGAGVAFTRNFAAGFTFALRTADFFADDTTVRFAADLAAGLAERDAAAFVERDAEGFAFAGAVLGFGPEALLGADFFAGLSGRFEAFAFTAFFDFAIGILTPLV